VRLLEALGRLAVPTGGQILLDGQEMKEFPEAVTGRAIGYVDGTTFLPTGTVEDLLLEVLRNRVVTPARIPSSEQASAAQRLLEAQRSGNFEFEPSANWIDRAAAGGGTDLAGHMQSVTRMAGLSGDIRDIGLASRLRPDALDRIQPLIGRARMLLREKLTAAGLENLVEPFDPDRYNMQASVAENILFGMPIDPAFAPQALARNPIVKDLLRETGLGKLLLALGLDAARTFREMFADLPSTSALFGQATGTTPEQIEKLRAILDRIDQTGIGAISPEDEDALVTLSMDYVEPRDRFGILREEVKEKVVEARRRLRERLEGQSEEKIRFNDFNVYNPSLTIADNILFGRIETNLVGGRARIMAALAAVLAELDISSLPFEAGLAFYIGPGGRGLSEAQRQKLRLARALMKKPDFLILNRALASLPGREQRDILEAILSEAQGPTGAKPGVMCMPADPSLAALFDRVLLLRHGRVAADAPPDSLREKHPDLAGLAKG
jgi:putative ABC transport system ATP-binding protein